MRIQMKLILMGILAITLTGCFDDQIEIVNNEYNKALYESLYIQHEMVKNSEDLKNSDIKVHVGEDILNAALKTLKGIKLEPKEAKANINDLVLQINKVDLSPEDGASDVELEIEAISDANKMKVTFHVYGGLFFDNAEKNKLAFKVKIREIKSSVSWWKISASYIDILDDYLTVEAVKSLEGALTFSIPLLKLDKQSLSVDETMIAKDDETGSEFSLKMTSPLYSIDTQLSLQSFVFSSHGITLFGNIDKSIPDTPVAPSIEGKMVLDEIKRLQASIMDINSTQIEKNGLTLSLRPSVIDSVIAKFNSIPTPNRTIAVKSTSVKGNIYENIWTDDILGKGGFFAKLNGRDAINGTATISSIRHKLNDNGLAYGTNINIAASAKVKTHFDPLVGGGIGKLWTLNGKTNPEITGNLALEIIKTNTGINAVVFKNSLTCTKFSVNVKDSGALKLGVNVSEVIGGDKPSMNSVISSIPTYIDLISQTKNDDFAIIFPKKFLEIKYSPNVSTINSSGIQFSLAASIKYVDDKKDTEKSIKSLEVAIKALENSSLVQVCPEKDSLKVLIADTEFGENNEFVNLISNIYTGFKQGLDSIEQDLTARQKALFNPGKDGTLHEPLKKPLKTAACLVSFGKIGC